MRGATVAALALGCGPAVAFSQDVDGTTSAAAETTSGSTTTSGSATVERDETSTNTGTTTGVAESTGPDEWPPGFIVPPDAGGPALECDVWTQNCPPGEKCMPWAYDGGVSWNATRCVSIGPEPGQPGDDCTVEGSGVSGVDTCDIASMCWNIDPETNEGTCTAFCLGSENNPVCVEPEHFCAINGEGVLILCLPTCHPLLQDCLDSEGCYGVADDFVCAPDVSGDAGGFGDPCEAINVCNPGLECINAEVVPGCAGAVGCCSPFCDHTEPDECPTGLTCVPLFEPGQATPGNENVGACFVPA